MIKTFIALIPTGVFFLHADTSNSPIISYVTTPKNIHFYLKDSQGNSLGNFQRLRNHLETKNQHVTFAMNGGMYLKDLSPQGLYIENGKQIKAVNRTQTAYGNFYMQPNGIFYITRDKKAYVTATKDFHADNNILYATQSGPMLVINGKLHPRFIRGSQNLYVRNGVGVLPDGRLLFAISSRPINFYDFGTFFKNRGCKNALYLDGFVSRIYLPGRDLVYDDGLFGVIIAEVVHD